MDFAVIGSMAGIGFLALCFGAFLGYAAKKFHVPVDPRVEQVEDVLPGANCGACAFAGCAGYAKAVVEGKAAVDACTPGGEAVAKAIAGILGVEAGASTAMIAVLKCRGDIQLARDAYIYEGIHDCGAAKLVQGGPKACPNGCIGLGTCVEACPFDAMAMGENGLPNIFRDKCTGCGACVVICPNDVLELMPAKDHVWIACNNNYSGKLVKEVCGTGCIACRLCVKECPFDAITFDNNLAHIDYEKCKNCEICVVVCPTGTINTKKSGEILNDSPKVRAAREKKKAKEKEKKLAEANAVKDSAAKDE
ncbi:MAG: RnfABCDGE type electron transport complex subunit B [bacterium]